MNYMDFLGGGFAEQMPNPTIPGGGTPIMPQQMGGLFGGGPPPQMSPLQGMGLGSPFFRPMPNQGFTPSRTNAMSPQAMTLLGMDPNMPNMVGPTSALPAEMQPQASQLKMYGMNNQNQPSAPAPAPALPAPNPTSLAPNDVYNMAQALNSYQRYMAPGVSEHDAWLKHQRNLVYGGDSYSDFQG